MFRKSYEIFRKFASWIKINDFNYSKWERKLLSKRDTETEGTDRQRVTEREGVSKRDKERERQREMKQSDRE